MLKYKNYSGIVEYDSHGKIFTGEVIGLRDVITFQGRTPEELEQSFRESIDFYLEMCARDGVSPQKPYSGRFNLRLTPEMHMRIAEKAALEKVSINQWVTDALREVLQEKLEERRAATAYRAWQQDKSLGRPYHQVRDELTQDGLLDE